MLSSSVNKEDAQVAILPIDIGCSNREKDLEKTDSNS